jgi:hypothetical protein
LGNKVIKVDRDEENGRCWSVYHAALCRMSHAIAIWQNPRLLLHNFYLLLFICIHMYGFIYSQPAIKAIHDVSKTKQKF